MKFTNDRRKNERRLTNEKVQMSFVQFSRNEFGEMEEDLRMIEAYVRDISLGGISFFSHQSFAIGKTCYLFVRIHETRYGLTGKIIRSDRNEEDEQQGYQVGIMFEKVLNDQGVYVPADDVLSLINQIK